MASWTLITYTRGSTDNPWLNPSSAVLDKVTEYQNTDPKKILHYEKKDSADGLKRYYKLGFKDEVTALEFRDTAENVASFNQRKSFCDIPANQMTFLINNGLNDEPSIPA